MSKMRLGFSAWAMRERPVDEQLAIIRDAGYASTCLVSGPTFPLDAVTIDAAEKKRIRQLLTASELELSAIAGHATQLEPDPDKLRANADRIRATIDLAVDLAGPEGPPCVVSMGYGTPETYEHDRALLAERFGALAEYAGTRGVTLVLEPHVGQAMDAPEKVVWLMQAVNSPSFKLNLDNSHFECMGRDLDDYLPILIPYAVHTDLKDQRGIWPNHEFLVPGEGDFDYARYLTAMEKAGYEGCVTVEISVMVQRRPDYDPAEVARRSFAVLRAAEEASGVSLIHR
ncbi:MAG: sugar phosphate isomerase/epimerase [Chloroflexi bacterium]|nr:sugar phosphate isomerase/epimerase [Chloroflexota bacterium]